MILEVCLRKVFGEDHGEDLEARDQEKVSLFVVLELTSSFPVTQNAFPASL